MEITWKLHVNDANYVLDCLADRPFKQTSGLIGSLKAQADQQVAQAQQPKVDTQPEPKPAEGAKSAE